ncbi:hypothetical protein [Streptomyces sp. NPDC054866]
MRFVDERGRTRLDLPADFAGGEIEVLRGDLARALHEHSVPYTEYVFGDSIVSLTETSSSGRARWVAGCSPSGRRGAGVMSL